MWLKSAFLSTFNRCSRNEHAYKRVLLLQRPKTVCFLLAKQICVFASNNCKLRVLAAEHLEAIRLHTHEPLEPAYIVAGGMHEEYEENGEYADEDFDDDASRPSKRLSKLITDEQSKKEMSFEE